MTDELEFSSQHGPRFYLFSTAFRLVLEPTQPSLQWAQGLPQGWSIQVMKLSTRLHLAPRLKTHRTILPLFYTSPCYDASLSIATTTLPSSFCSPTLFFIFPYFAVPYCFQTSQLLNIFYLSSWYRTSVIFNTEHPSLSQYLIPPLPVLSVHPCFHCLPYEILHEIYCLLGCSAV